MRFIVFFALAAHFVAAQQAPATNASNTTSNAAPAAANATAPTLPAPGGLGASIVAPLRNLTAGIVNSTVGAVNSTANATLPAAASVPTNGRCVRQCVRKEFRSLSLEERKAFLNAVRRLQSMPATGTAAAAKGQAQITEYDRFVKMHLDATQFAHGTDYFLPWHRAYLREFEMALQRVDPSVCLPYWLWSMDSQSPEYSPLLTAEYFGGSGSGADNCVQDGAFAQWRPAYPQPHCMRRTYGDSLGAFHSTEAVNRAISTLRTYPEFRSHVEGVLHPTPHMNMGGDMSTMQSPNDPIFWLHHGYVDYMYSKFQKRNGLAFSQDVNTRFPGLGDAKYSAADVLDARTLCYDYGELSAQDLGDDTVVPPPPAPQPKAPRPSPAPRDNLPEGASIVPIPENVSDADRYSSHDRSNLGSLRYADPVSREWCEHNNIPYEQVQVIEEGYRAVYKQLNSIKGYVSPCALMKRPTLHVRIIQARKVEQFYVDVPDLGRVEVAYKPEVAQADPYQAVANVQEKVFACSPDVEAPPEEYRASIQKLIGDSAFSGAADPLRITELDQVPQSGAGVEAPARIGLVTMAALAVVALVL